MSTIFRLDKGHSQTRQPGSSPGTRNTPGLAPGSLRHPSRNTSWETEVLYGKLDQNLSRPMGPTNDLGLQARMVRTSYSGGSPSIKKLTRQLGSDAEGVRYSAPKRSNSSTGPPKPQEGFLFHDFPSPKIRGKIQGGYKPKAPKSLYPDNPFQNGGDSPPTGPPTEAGLAVPHRPNGCLFYCSRAPPSPGIPAFLMGGEGLPVHMPPIWPLISTPSFHETPKASNRLPQEPRSPLYYLHGRPAHYSPITRHVSPTHSSSTGPVRITRLSGKLQEIPPHPYARVGLSGIQSGCQSKGTNPSLREGAGNSGRGTQLNQQREVIGPPSSKADWETFSSNFSSSPSSTPLQESAATKAPSSSSPGLRWGNSAFLGRPSRICSGAPRMEREEPRRTSGQFDYRDGCLQDRMGGILPGDSHRRLLVASRVQMPYQLPRVDSSPLRSKGLCKAPDTLSRPSEDRQQDGCCLHQPNGRHEIAGSSGDCAGAMAVVPGSADYTSGSVPSWMRQHLSRLLSQHLRDRMDWILNPALFNRLLEIWGPMEVDLFATRCSAQLPKFYSWRPDPDAQGTDAFRQSWSGALSYAHPPWCLVARVLWKARIEEATLVLIAPVWPTQHWYPPLLSLLIDYPILLPRRPGTLIPSPNCDCPVGVDQPQLAAWKVSGSASLQKAFQEKLQHSSWLLGDTRQMRTTTPHGGNGRAGVSLSVDPFSAHVSQILAFLADQFKAGKQYRSLNVYRSALSSVHLPVDGFPVGQHLLVSRLLKGAFNTRPPMPKYEKTWEVHRVTVYLRSLGENSDLGLKLLTHKLAMLLALVSAHRSSDLVRLTLQGKRQTPSGIFLKPSGLAKQSRPGQEKGISPVFIPAFLEDSRLCQVRCLEAYERATGTLRSHQQLFLGVVAPHKPVCSSTIARWLKEVLKASGIDTAVFSAHSTRGASASSAALAGVSTQDIMNRAGWSQQSTFCKFYYRPSAETQKFTSIRTSSSVYKHPENLLMSRNPPQYNYRMAKEPCMLFRVVQGG